jgi:hypothetical protein
MVVDADFLLRTVRLEDRHLGRMTMVIKGCGRSADSSRVTEDFRSHLSQADATLKSAASRVIDSGPSAPQSDGKK